MKLIFNILMFNLFGIFIISCQQNSIELPMLVDINSALELSGNNRGELQKVLDYYREEKPDPLKLKAAEYLICNMVARYSVAGETMDRLKRDIDTTLREQPRALKQIFYLIAARIAMEQKITPLNTIYTKLHRIS